MIRYALMAAAAVVATPATAATTVIGFDNLTSTYTAGPTYVESGYKFTAVLCSATFNCFRPAASNISIDPTGTAVTRAGGSTSTTIEREDGGAFTFDSMDFGKTSTTNNTASSTYEFQFTLAGSGTVVSKYFSFDWKNPSPVTVNTASFVGIGEITKLSFRNASTAAQFDNVRLTSAAAVPEPATWALMVGGFGLVGGVMRRRSTAVRFA